MSPYLFCVMGLFCDAGCITFGSSSSLHVNLNPFTLFLLQDRKYLPLEKARGKKLNLDWNAFTQGKEKLLHLKYVSSVYHNKVWRE